MAGWSRANFEDVEPRELNGVDARFMRRILDSPELGVSRFTYPPGGGIGFAHKHATQEELYVILEGMGRLQLDDEEIDVGPGDVVRVAPDTVRELTAGDEGLTVICVGGPVPAGGDGIKVPPAPQ